VVLYLRHWTNTCTIKNVFEALAEAIEGLEAPAGGDELAGLIALGDRLDAVITAAVGEFDRSGGWELEGDESMRRTAPHGGE
jgi:hypothetical protein